jgi:hypothetical protein
MAFNFGGRAFNFDLDTVVSTNLAKINTGASNVLSLGTDACNVMGTVGAMTPDQETAVSAAETEEKTTEMLTAMANASGQLTEAVSEVEQVRSTVDAKITTVNDLMARMTGDKSNARLQTKLQEAMIKYMDAVEGKVTNINTCAGTAAQVDGKDIGTLLEENITEAQTKLNTCTEKLGSFVTASGGLNCKKIQEALLNTEFDAEGDVGALSKNTKSKVPRHTRRMQDNGSLVNFNIDRKKPYRDVMRTIQVRNLDAGENEDPFETKEVLVRIYGDQAVLDKHLGKKVETNPLPDTIAV